MNVLRHSLLILTTGGLLLAAPYRAQAQKTATTSLAGNWQGVETDPDEPGKTWPAELRVQNGQGSGLFGVLYQEASGQRGVTVTFQVRATRTATGLELEHLRKLNETGRTPFSYWCDGAITFTYNAQEEKLTGRAAYNPYGTCDKGTFTLYRVRLKSAAKVPAGTETTLRVSGRDVRWYADADLKQIVNSGNEFRTKLSRTTTYYIVQGYYRTVESAVTPITVQVGAAPKPAPTPPPPAPAPEPALPPLDTARRAPAVAATPPPAPVISEKPVVLPTVLFKLGTAELLPDAYPALDQLAAQLRDRPTLQLQIAGHTDRIGEPQKNLVLSEQRAESVKQFLVKAGIEASRLRTVGYGDARPLHPSPDARNRRVEVQQVP